jgi:ferredoxin
VIGEFTVGKIRRKIISIDEEKCDGCGLCVPSCAEGALQVLDGKARLVSEVYCDGLGNCLGECPRGAITIIEKEAEPFDEKAVEDYLGSCENDAAEPMLSDCSSCCSSTLEMNLDSKEKVTAALKKDNNEEFAPEAELSHWPFQLHLVSPQARFLKEADLLIAADCVPFAYADFHRRFLAGKALIIGCPKLDDLEAYHNKLVEIFKISKLKSITLVHMEVGCCFGLSKLVKSALAEANMKTPLEEVIIGVDGTVKSN